MSPWRLATHRRRPTSISWDLLCSGPHTRDPRFMGAPGLGPQVWLRPRFQRGVGVGAMSKVLWGREPRGGKPEGGKSQGMHVKRPVSAVYPNIRLCAQH